MTEAEWLPYTDPQKMLEFLRGQNGNRKFRLFAVACCRHLWNRITVNPWDRRAVDVAELFADGKASLRDLQEAADETTSDWTAAFACAEAASPEGGVDAAIYCADNAEHAAGEHPATPDDDHPALAAGQAMERQAQAALLRCIFGPLPFRPIIIDPAWLAWKGATILKLAQAIYDDRAFDHLPILADTLEEAGCTNADILNHCRQPGEHVRGCWVIDLILGKE